MEDYYEPDAVGDKVAKAAAVVAAIDLTLAGVEAAIAQVDEAEAKAAEVIYLAHLRDFC